MPAASEVRSEECANVRIRFDNGCYAVISDEYEGEAAFAEYWNGNDKEHRAQTQPTALFGMFIPEFYGGAHLVSGQGASRHIVLKYFCAAPRPS